LQLEWGGEPPGERHGRGGLARKFARAALVWRSALLVFAVLRRRGLAKSRDSEMLAITSIELLHVLLVVVIIQSGTPCACTR
jgi:hypothetical protein